MIAIALRLLSSPHTWWAALAAGLAISGWHTAGQRDAARQQLAQVQAQHAQAEALRSETARQAEADNRAREQAHAATLQAVTQKAAHEKTRLAADLQRTIDSLRNRPERPAIAGGAVPSGASDPVGCTGAELFRPDAEFLVRESARADQLRLALGQCQAAYDSAVILTAPP